MSATRAALKAAKAALDAKRWEEVISQSEMALSLDPKNYFAYVLYLWLAPVAANNGCRNLFLGRAFDKQGKPADAAKAYNEAAKIKPEDDQAWQGLRILYEGQGGKSVDEYITVAVRLAEIYAEA
jgi:superkiller protein 3